MPHYKQPKIGGKCDKSMLRHERQPRVKDKLKQQNIKFYRAEVKRRLNFLKKRCDRDNT